ncbi:MAG: hypothetical protein CVU89_09200 [Firmicutes bacterium HGW-Firmicutes-14]|jgi:hypothetical protein|nr:MAG: hypothetical protein CVU89_09200 [Firmicutes bacterium HGW-Firmicutes-14]
MNRHAETEYRRYAAVLREDLRDYAITRVKRPRGKAVIETAGARGVLRCSVRNLCPPKTRDRHSGYGIWIVGEHGDRRIPVHAGNIEISEEGIGETEWSFATGNVNGTGLGIDSFDTLEVCVCTAAKHLPGDRVLVGELELEEANIPEEPKMEKVSPFGTGLPLYQWWKFYPSYFNDLIYNPLAHSNPSDIQAFTEACSDVFSNFMTGPVFRGHQLIGLQYDRKGTVKFLVHGIPGRFCLRDQPYGGDTGYVYWHPLPGQNYRAGDYGYWLIHINPLTGEVVFPKRTTKPPDCEQCNREDIKG